MAEARKVIITCAITGSIHTPSMSPHLPVTPREIADAAVGAAEAGAAIVHLHARDPVDGHPTQDPRYFREFAARHQAAARTSSSTSPPAARATMTIEERLQPALQLKPEVASLNMGSMNFGLFPMLERFKEFKYDWERTTSRARTTAIFNNTFKDIEYILTSCARQRHALRDRVLRHRPSVHGAPLPRARHRQAAALHPERVRHPRRHRPASGRRHAHEAHRRSPVRRPVSVERARRRPQPAADRGACRRRWAVTSASVSRTASGSVPASSRNPTPHRFARCGRSSKDWACRSQRPTTRGGSSRSRADRTSRSKVARATSRCIPC